MKSRSLSALTLLGAWAWSLSAGLGATTLSLQPGSDLVGELRHVEARHEHTLIDIARSHQVGFEAIRNANPDLNTWIPGEGARVLLPLQFVLPEAPRRDIVINLPEMRLYYFAADGKQVMSYPVSIGRMDWNTPLGTLKITEKRENPTWTPPQSVRESYAAQGKSLPAVVPPGPDNPMGEFAMRLSRPSYLIHGTNWSTGIGMRATHGCIRMDNNDIRTLYGRVPVGTSVNIVNQPFKAGWKGDVLYLEAHPPLEEFKADHSITPAIQRIMAVVGEKPARVDWTRVREVAEAATGVPQPVGYRGELTALPELRLGQRPAMAAVPEAAGDWFVQMGSFSEVDRARMLSARLEQEGFPVNVSQFSKGERPMYRVLLGPVQDRAAATDLGEQVARRMLIEGMVIQLPR